MCGVCNGFQALIKLGLVPYGKIIDTDASCPTLTYNTIGRHQSRLVRTRVASNRSPWLKKTQVGEVYTVPISHGEGRFFASDELIAELAKNGQIATQYVDLNGEPTFDIRFNPTVRRRPLRASPARTAACWAKWAIPSAMTPVCTRTCLAGTTWGCLSRPWSTLSKRQ